MSDSVTITGIGGRFPESNNVDEFWTNLLSGNELCTMDDRRWPVGFLKLPPRSGKIPGIEKFDAEFFGINSVQGNDMDPQIKLCHETTFEAIIDAGLDPVNLAGPRTGMFIGSCYNDSLTAQTEDGALYKSKWIENFSQVSKNFNFNGPCLTYDSACASSFSAFNEAVKLIQANVIDTGIVAGVAICTNPCTASGFRQLGMTSSDGRSRCMDKDANGYVRSETVCSIVLQRKSVSKRVYACVLNSRTNSDGYKKEGITFPGQDSMVKLMKETYEEIGLDPKDTKYIEAHVTGTQAGDPVECGAIERVFCPEDRDGPILMGCLKSNMGHAEGASGTAAITKACLIFQKKIIPPSIHYIEPNPNIPGLLNGKLKAVLKMEKFNGSIISLNSFGFGGSNIHTIIKSNDEIVNSDVQNICGMNGINRLILFKTRTEESFKKLLLKLKQNPEEITTEFLDILSTISKLDSKWNLPYRGYFILDSEKKIISFDWKNSKNLTTNKVAPEKDTNNNISNETLIQIGQKFMDGADINLDKLYPTIKYPISRTTASISSLISWNHEKDWTIYKVPEFFRFSSRSKRFHFDYSGHYHYLSGHKIDGRIIVPASQYLWCIWQSLAMESIEHSTLAYLKTGIKFWNVKLNRAILVERGEEVALVTAIDTTTGFFEITQNGSCLVTGHARLTYEDSVPSLIAGDIDKYSESIKNDDLISKREFYKELRVRGYDYEDDFQGVIGCNPIGTEGTVSFLRNWVTFADAVFQLTLINEPSRQLLLPTGFELLQVDAKIFRNISTADYELYKTILESSAVEKNENEDIEDVRVIADPKIEHKMEDKKLDGDTDKKIPIFKVLVSKDTLEASTNGLYIKGMNATPAPRRKATPTVRSIAFTEFNELFEEDIDEKIMKQEYSEKCLEVIRNTEISNDDNNNLEEDIAKDISKNTEIAEVKEHETLLSVLKNIKKENIPLIQGLKENSSNISSDILLKIPLNHSSIHHQWDIVTEIFLGQNLNITEVNLSAKSNIQKTIEELLIEKCPQTSYALYNDENFDGQQETIDKYLNQTTISSELILIQHPSLGFTFLDSVESAQEKEQKFSKVVQSSFEKTNNGCFLMVIARSKMSVIEMEILDTNKPDIASVENIGKLVESSGYVKISEKVIGSYFSILARKHDCAHTKPEIFSIDSYSYEWVDKLRDCMFIKTGEGDQEVTKAGNNNPIWIRCNDSDISGLHGFINCVRHEDKRFNGITIMDKNCDQDTIITECIKNGLKMNIYKDGALGTMKHSPFKEEYDKKISQNIELPNSGIENIALSLDIETKGDLSSLKYHKIRIPENSKNICNIAYAALNFKDIMVASGRVPTTAYPPSWRNFNSGDLGMEFSGINIHGDRVMGLVSMGAIATKLDLKIGSDFLFKIPQNISLEEAATIPVVYSTVYYALIMRGKLFPGERILIHAGSGGVGQAAINVCSSMGCEIYTTVGSELKRKFIRETYPTIKDDHIFDSRSTRFGDDILRATDGTGVDVVLNCLSEGKLQVGLTCLAENGRFIEIGKYDFMNNSSIDPSHFTRNQSFQSVCLAYFTTKASEYTGHGVHPEVRMLRSLIENGLAKGVIKPLSRHVFEMDQVEEAFRFMATGKHMGKVLIKMNSNVAMNEVNIERGSENGNIQKISSVKERVSFDPMKSYIVIGGLGGIGLEICYWLVKKGVRHLIILSRTGIRTAYHTFCIERMENEFNANVIVKTVDISNINEAEKLIFFAQTFGPVGGIFNLAMVLKDALFEDQTKELFEECCNIKILGTRNLDIITRNACTDSLDHFVCFSSLVSTFGNAGQSNYGLANGYMDNLCAARCADGFPALSIGWGAVGDVGHVAENMGHDVIVAGSIPQRINSCLDVLERVLYSKIPIIGSFVPVDRSNFEVKGGIVDTILNVLGIRDQSKIDPKSNLGDLGLDSLMAVEIKQILEKKYDTTLSTKEIRELTLEQIKNMSPH